MNRGMPERRGRGMGTEKLSSERRKAVIFRLWKYLSQMRLPLIIIGTVVVVSNLFALIGPKLSEPAINAIKPGAVDFDTVFYYVGLMILFYVASACLSFLQSFLMTTVSKRITFNIRRDLYEKLSRLPVKFFDTHQSAERDALTVSTS